MNPQSQLKVFLSHSPYDITVVRTLFSQLKKEGIAAWLDEKNLSPDHDRQNEIPKAVRNSHVVVVCLSREATTKSGFIHKEVKHALDVADEHPDGTIFIVPLRLDDCKVPERLSHLHYVNYFEKQGYEKLLVALHRRAWSLNIEVPGAIGPPWEINIAVIGISAQRKLEVGISMFSFLESGNSWQLELRVSDRDEDGFRVSFEFYTEIGEVAGTQLSHKGISRKQSEVLMGPIARHLDRLRPGTTYDSKIETLLKRFFAEG